MTGFNKKRVGGLLANGWNFGRIFRFVMGIAMVLFAILSHDVLAGFAGGLLSLMAIFNFGCCAMGSCSIPVNRQRVKTSSKGNAHYL